MALPGVAIKTLRDCMSCHNQPVLGGGNKINQDKPTEPYRDDNNDYLPHDRQFFTSNKRYRDVGDDMSQLLLGNQRDARARVDFTTDVQTKPYPLLTKLQEKFDDDLTEIEAARELGLPDDALQGVFSGDGYTEKTVDQKKQRAIPRAQFEATACGLRSDALKRAGGQPFRSTAGQHLPQ
jgi:hypothetical protein